MFRPFIFVSGREGFQHGDQHNGNLRADLECLERYVTRDPTLAEKSTCNRTVALCLLLLSLGLSFTACSIKRLAVNSLADALTEGSASVYATDDDPVLVGQALPFALKTMEALLQETPHNKALLISTASGFVQYAHAYVLQPANTLEFTDLNAARAERERAKRLFIRARDYGLRALELDYPNLTDALNADPKDAIGHTKKDDIPAIYWTGVAWGSAISVSKNDMSFVAEVPIVRALLERALELNPSWEYGAIHEFFIIFDAGRSESEGGGIAQAEKHFKRAMELNGGRSVGPLVSLAESVCVLQQDRARFRFLLTQALDFDVDRYPEKRLANILAQKKAAELLENIDQLFYVDEEGLVEESPKTTK